MCIQLIRYGCDTAGIACDLNWEVGYGDTDSMWYNVSYLLLGIVLAVIMTWVLKYTMYTTRARYILILYVCIIREHKKMGSLQQCTCYFYILFYEIFYQFVLNSCVKLAYFQLFSFVCNNVNKQVWWTPKGVNKSANFFKQIH